VEASNRVPEADADAAELLYRTRYSGFTAKRFHEHLVGTHALRWGFTRTQALLHKRGLLAARRPGGRTGASVRIGPCRG
jgi:hypothetical protein